MCQGRRRGGGSGWPFNPSREDQFCPWDQAQFSQVAGRRRGGHGPGTSEGWPRPSALPEGPPDSGASFRPSDWHGSLRPRAKAPGAPRAPTLGSPLLCQPGYWAGAWQGHPSASSLSSFLLPAGTCPAERRVPGSNPDAGWAPACSSRGRAGGADSWVCGHQSEAQAWWWEHSGALPRVQASRLVDPDAPEW